MSRDSKIFARLLGICPKKFARLALIACSLNNARQERGIARLVGEKQSVAAQPVSATRQETRTRTTMRRRVRGIKTGKTSLSFSGANSSLPESDHQKFNGFSSVELWSGGLKIAA